ncbi:kinase-like domain-containing protein [Rhizopus microsporus]
MNRLMEVKSRSRKGTFESRYIKLHTLGSGNFGKVYLVEEKATGKLCAAKVVDKKIFKAGDQKLHAEREQKICETFAKRLTHKHIVQIYDVFTEQDFIYIIMEYVEGGELFHKIREQKRLNERLARKWFREIIEAVDYIHDNNIVHRDLKPENVLINNASQVQLCDFGFGNMVKQRRDILSTYCGSPFYAAPEMVTATPYEGPPADLWSCGVILFAMLTGSLPFQADQMPELFRKIKAGEYQIPSQTPSKAADLIRRLLCVDAQKRITAKECLLHPWLTAEDEEPRRLTDHSSPQSTLTYSYHPPYSPPKFKTISEETLSSAGLETKQHYYPNVVAEKKPFFLRIFKRRMQIAPTDNHYNEKKLLKQRVMGKFRSLFVRKSLQQPRMLES